MLPIGPLMKEHRFIEKFLVAMDTRLEAAWSGTPAGLILLDRAVDFFRVYADRSHHGKEENILFRDLARKPLAEPLRRTMSELIRDHLQGRELVGALAAGRERLAAGAPGAVAELRECWRTLRDFYPRHIRKEDKDFFLPVMEYFTPEEKASMLQEGYVLDQELFHLAYQDWVESLSRS